MPLINVRTRFPLATDTHLIYLRSYSLLCYTPQSVDASGDVSHKWAYTYSNGTVISSVPAGASLWRDYFPLSKFTHVFENAMRADDFPQPVPTCRSLPSSSQPEVPPTQPQPPPPVALTPAPKCLPPTHTPYSLLPTPYSLLPTSYHLPPTAYRLPPNAFHLPPTAYHLPPPPTAYHLPPHTTCYLLHATYYLLPTTEYQLYYRLLTADYQLPNTDY